MKKLQVQTNTNLLQVKKKLNTEKQANCKKGKRSKSLKGKIVECETFQSMKSSFMTCEIDIKNLIAN